MKVVDVNLLIYSVDSHSAFHEKARAWLEGALSGTEPVAFAWVTLLGFIRISTRAGALRKPISPEQALASVSSWLAAAPATIVQPTPRHFKVVSDLLLKAGTAGNLTTDAHLAALAIEHGAEVVSGDTDFGRFAGLRWSNPLA